MLRDGKMEFLFQPLVDFENAQLLGFESQARWIHPTRGEIASELFLAMALELNLMRELDLAAMHACTQTLAMLRNDGFDTLVVSFNASSQTLTQDSFVNRLDWELDRLNLPADHIAVEAHENAVISSSGAIRDSQIAIQRLKDLGVRVALDDFGVGYAGLSHLAQLNFNGVKTDCSLIEDIADNPARRKIFTTIVELCATLKIRLIAKGVNDQATAKVISDLGCNLVQGHVAAKPMPASALVKWTRSGAFQPAVGVTPVFTEKRASQST